MQILTSMPAELIVQTSSGSFHVHLSKNWRKIVHLWCRNSTYVTQGQVARLFVVGSDLNWARHCHSTVLQLLLFYGRNGGGESPHGTQHALLRNTKGDPCGRRFPSSGSFVEAKSTGTLLAQTTFGSTDVSSRVRHFFEKDMTAAMRAHISCRCGITEVMHCGFFSLNIPEFVVCEYSGQHRHTQTGTFGRARRGK